MFRNRSPSVKLAAGECLPDVPRLNLPGKSLIVGSYDSAEAHELHLVETYGSGDPLLDTTDEIRFSSRTSRLVSCRIGVPERPVAEAAFVEHVAGIPVTQAVPTLDPPTAFQVVIATNTHIDPDGRTLFVFDARASVPRTRLMIATDLEMVLAEDRICGFVLHHPARYLTRGWTKVQPLADDTTLGPLLASYINVLSEEFIDRLDDADPGAREVLVTLLGALDAESPSGQRDVLVGAIESILDTFLEHPPRAPSGHD